MMDWEADERLRGVYLLLSAVAKVFCRPRRKPTRSIPIGCTITCSLRGECSLTCRTISI